MDLFEALKKRRAIREFTEDPLSDEIISKLVYAASRASTGNNAPYRRILVVRDWKTIRLIKQLSPGILGLPTALIVIFTEMDIANELGKLGNICSTIDAGAAAENVALAAASMGIGACFTRSYSEAGVKEILDIPDNCRTELMLQLGHPKREQPPPLRPRAGADAVYLNRYGLRWESK